MSPLRSSPLREKLTTLPPLQIPPPSFHPSPRPSPSARTPKCCAHGGCRRRRWLLLLLGTLVFLTVSLSLFALLVAPGKVAEAIPMGKWLGGEVGLWKRQSAGDGSGGESTFTSHKLWVIIAVVVGLILIMFAGISLAACCCRGAFQNPICCPCYTCACLGGLACLECCACGLCAEGLDELV